MTDRSDPSRWWYLTASALAIGVLALPFARIWWLLGSSVPSVSTSIAGTIVFVSACLSGSLNLDARRTGNDDWDPNPQLYAVGGVLYLLSLVVGTWYLLMRYWNVGLAGVNAVEPPSDEWLAASRWHYWIALGPVWCLVGGVAALAFGLSGLLVGTLCWVIGFGLFVLAINVDVRHVRAAELERSPAWVATPTRRCSPCSRWRLPPDHARGRRRLPLPAAAVRGTDGGALEPALSAWTGRPLLRTGGARSISGRRRPRRRCSHPS